MVHRLQDHLPVPLLRGDRDRRQPGVALPAGGASGAARPLLHRAGAAARGDHADRRAAGRVDRRPARGQGRAARPGHHAHRDRRGGGGDAAPLRRLAAPHDPGRLPALHEVAALGARPDGGDQAAPRRGRHAGRTGWPPPAPADARRCGGDRRGPGLRARGRAAPVGSRLHRAVHRHRRRVGGRDRGAGGRLLDGARRARPRRSPRGRTRGGRARSGRGVGQQRRPASDGEGLGAPRRGGAPARGRERARRDVRVACRRGRHARRRRPEPPHHQHRLAVGARARARPRRLRRHQARRCRLHNLAAGRSQRRRGADHRPRRLSGLRRHADGPRACSRR